MDWVTNMKIGIFDLENGQIERNATTEEKKQIEKEIAENETLTKLRDGEADAKAAQRQALLNRLGITEEQAKLLLS